MTDLKFEQKKEKIPFIHQVKRLDYDFYSKIIFFSFMLMLLSCLWITFCGIGFQPNYVSMVGDAQLVGQVPSGVQTVRDLFLFALFWYTTFLIWTIIQITWYFKLKPTDDIVTEAFIAMSMIPFLNIGTIVVASKKNKYDKFLGWLKNPFTLESEIDVSASRWKWVMYFIVLIVMTPMVIMLWFPIPSTEQAPPPGTENFVPLENMWFDGLQFFTIQTNLMCYIYVIFKLMFPRAKMFKNDSILVCLIAYIVIVCLTYNFALLPFQSEKAKLWPARKWAKTIWEHIINPIVFVSTGFVSMKKNKIVKNSNSDLMSTLKFGMIVPTIYLLYALFSPFLTTTSVYDWVTNCNPTLPNSFSHHPFGAWYIIFFMIAYWFIFVGVITLNRYFRDLIYKKSIKSSSDSTDWELKYEPYR